MMNEPVVPLHARFEVTGSSMGADAPDRPQEACGVFAVVAAAESVASLCYFGLYALQHRGQESAGIAVFDGQKVRLHKDMGLVSQVFDQDVLERLPGTQAVGHTRYSTTGSSRVCNAQPLVLGALAPAQYWAEMAFSLPVRSLSAQALDALISQRVLPGQPRPALQPRQLEGMLTDFMDLVVEHQGRYHVLDYKSNRLPDYAPPTLAQAVLAHRYDVQYSLYLLALHRLLKWRLPGYSPQRHLGGAIYLFARGIDQPGQGVFFERPPHELIESLDQAFAQPEQPA